MTEDPRADLPESDPGAESQDDEIIARALRGSLVVLLLVGAVVGLYFWLAGPGEGGPEVVPDQLPEVRPSVVLREAPPLPFTDITAESGVDFPHRNGARGEKLLPETMGSGVAFFDLEGDGDADLLLARGTEWSWTTGVERLPSLGLFRNDGAGRFEDVSEKWGLTDSFMATGVAVGDYNGDGAPDLFIAAVGEDRLYRHDGDRFTEVAQQAGVTGELEAWSSSAAFLDADLDGDLDLFVAQYVTWSREIDLAIGSSLTGRGRTYGQPTNFPGTHCRLHRNNGDGTFTDVSASAGIEILDPGQGQPAAKALAVAPIDVDGDGDLDIAVANDTVRNFLFLNDGDGTFKEVGERVGLAYDSNGKATGAMGIDAVRYRPDGSLAVAIGNFAAEMTSFFVTAADQLTFFDQNIDEGIGQPSRKWLSFGVFFFDADLDGWPDLLQTNGHLEDEIETVQPDQRYEQPAQLFWHCGPDSDACYTPTPDEKLGDLVDPIVGRGAAFADIDGDGDLDVCLTQVAGPPVLLRNDQALGNHWLRVRLEGKTANTGAIGAEVRLVAGGRARSLVVMPSRSYLSQVELPVTFGLGTETAVESLEIVWPDGERSRHPIEQIDTEIVIRQP